MGQTKCDEQTVHHLDRKAKMKYFAVGILVVFVAFAVVASAEDDKLPDQELLEAVERAIENANNDKRIYFLNEKVCNEILECDKRSWWAKDACRTYCSFW
ncbi:hypothetical protein DPMN_059577 [Dreissena polymorpha]|uniref:Uncharacterized protein n=1 Tax=Dreissena polymorpha TaxID=45954 RepID=A0A9D4C3R1_DREPO|nr:hypothetical protein DPMN_059577 [Dreissena polymorpha]